MTAERVTLRPYTAADEDAAIELWRRTWALHYPRIDFTARVSWWRERWRKELVPVAKIVLAETDDGERTGKEPLIPAQAGSQPEETASPLARGRAGQNVGPRRTLVGFVTIDPKTGYLDQIVVAPEAWGSDAARALLDEAKRLSPTGIELLVNKDNARAIRFYEKNGFIYACEDKNPVSGIAVNRMRWQPRAAGT